MELVRDLPSAQAFCEQSFGLAEVTRRELPGEPVEVTLGYASGAWLVLVAPATELEPALAKSQFPVVLLRTPELDAVVQRIEAAGTAVRRLPATPALRVAITRDPSGNTVEILDGGTGSQPVVGGSKLIVDDRKQAEEFYTSVFGVNPGQRYSSSAFDEVLLGFGSGPFLALFSRCRRSPCRRASTS